MGVEVTAADEADEGVDVLESAVGLVAAESEVEPGTGGGVDFGNRHVHGMQRHYICHPFLRDPDEAGSVVCSLAVYLHSRVRILPHPRPVLLHEIINTCCLVNK